MDKTSLGFQKPKEEEYYDINIFNQNAQLSNDLIEKNSSAIGQIAEKTLQGKTYTTTNLYKPADIANLKTGKVYGIIGDGTMVDGVTYHQGYGYNLLVYGHSVDLEDNVAVTQILTCTYNHQYEKRVLYRNYYLSSGGWSPWRTLSSEVCNPNLLINPGFQIWQRGTSFASFVNSILTYTADRWYATQAIGTTISVSKDSDNSLKFSQTGVGGSHVAQFIEGDYSNLVGKKVTMSICSKGNVDTVMQMLDYNTGLGGKVVPASTEYIITTLTVTLPNSLTKDRLRCLLNFANNQGSINIKWIKLELGEIATPLSPRPYGEELALCQRYYNTFYVRPVYYSVGAGAGYQTEYNFSIPCMRITPTVIQKITEGSKFNVYNSLAVARNEKTVDYTLISNTVGLCYAQLEIKLDAEIY